MELSRDMSMNQQLEDIIGETMKFIDHFDELKRNKELRRNPLFNEMLKDESQKVKEKHKKTMQYLQTLQYSSNIYVKRLRGIS